MAWAGAALGIGSQAAGQEAAADSTIEGAETQAAIEALNRQYQRKLFGEQMAANEPYYQSGLESLPMLEQFRTEGGVDLSGNPLYQMQQRAGMEGLDMAGGVRQGGRDYMTNAMQATGQQPAYNRLLDLQRVGMGAAGSAGNYAQNQGAALANSFQRGANAMAQGTAGAANQRQSLYSDAAGSIGQIPATYDYYRRTQ